MCTPQWRASHNRHVRVAFCGSIRDSHRTTCSTQLRGVDAFEYQRQLAALDPDARCTRRNRARDTERAAIEALVVNPATGRILREDLQMRAVAIVEHKDRVARRITTQR